MLYRILDSYVQYSWIKFCIDLGYNWFFMSRLWEGASAALGDRYFNIPRSWFIVYFVKLDEDDELSLRYGWPTIVFSIGVYFTDTDDSKGSRGTERNIFITHYHFHPLPNIKIFICNFACVMTPMYF